MRRPVRRGMSGPRKASSNSNVMSKARQNTPGMAQRQVAQRQQQNTPGMAQKQVAQRQQQRSKPAQKAAPQQRRTPTTRRTTQAKSMSPSRINQSNAMMARRNNSMRGRRR